MERCSTQLTNHNISIIINYITRKSKNRICVEKEARQQKLREFVVAFAYISENTFFHISFSLVKGQTKMLKDEQWRRIYLVVHALTLLLCSSMACNIVPYYHNPVSSRPNREIISHRQRFCGKLLKTRLRVPRSSAISEGGVSYNTLVSEVILIFFFNKSNLKSWKNEKRIKL